MLYPARLKRITVDQNKVFKKIDCSVCVFFFFFGGGGHPVYTNTHTREHTYTYKQKHTILLKLALPYLHVSPILLINEINSKSSDRSLYSQNYI